MTSTLQPRTGERRVRQAALALTRGTRDLNLTRQDRGLMRGAAGILRGMAREAREEWRRDPTVGQKIVDYSLELIGDRQHPAYDDARAILRGEL